MNGMFDSLYKVYDNVSG